MRNSGGNRRLHPFRLMSLAAALPTFLFLSACVHPHHDNALDESGKESGIKSDAVAGVFDQPALNGSIFADAEPVETEWFAQLEKGRKTGVLKTEWFVGDVAKEMEDNRAGGDKFDGYRSITRYAVIRGGRRLVVEEIEEYRNGDGGATEFSYRLKAGPQSLEVAGKILGRKMIFSVKRSGEATAGEKTWTVNLSATPSPPMLQRGLLEYSMSRGKKSWSYRALDLGGLDIVEVCARVVESGEGGLVIEETEPDTRRVARTRLDARGEVLNVKFPGEGIELRRVTEKEARTPFYYPAQDAFTSSTVIVKPAAIFLPETAASITYRVSVNGGDAGWLVRFASPRQFRQAGELPGEVIIKAGTEARDGPGAEPEVDSLLTASPQQLPPDNVEKKRLLAASPVCQSDDPRIRRRSMEITRGCKTDLEKIAVLTAWVAEHWRGTDWSVILMSASEVHERLRGDCTERGVYLAALLRAAAIPARAVLGLVRVSGSEYRFHFWIEAFAGGRWVELDPTWWPRPVGSGHLGLDTDDLRGLMLGPAAGRITAAGEHIELQWIRFSPAKTNDVEHPVE